MVINSFSYLLNVARYSCLNRSQVVVRRHPQKVFHHVDVSENVAMFTASWPAANGIISRELELVSILPSDNFNSRWIELRFSLPSVRAHVTERQQRHGNIACRKTNTIGDVVILVTDRSIKNDGGIFQRCTAFFATVAGCFVLPTMLFVVVTPFCGNTKSIEAVNLDRWCNWKRCDCWIMPVLIIYMTSRFRLERVQLCGGEFRSITTSVGLEKIHRLFS
mmetsp:Transcript_24170/g.71179  ORF Transcript_24170/g.71179 Transcript_24170/m.71179 type:complete len:220 (-) Transcript_24170:213-872(-)